MESIRVLLSDSDLGVAEIQELSQALLVCQHVQKMTLFSNDGRHPTNSTHPSTLLDAISAGFMGVERKVRFLYLCTLLLSYTDVIHHSVHRHLLGGIRTRRLGAFCQQQKHF